MKGRATESAIAVNATGSGEAVLVDGDSNLLIYDVETAKRLLMMLYNTHATRHSTIKVWGALKHANLTYTSADILAGKRWDQIGSDIDLDAGVCVMEWLDGEGYDYIALSGVSDADSTTIDLALTGVA